MEVGDSDHRYTRYESSHSSSKSGSSTSPSSARSQKSRKSSSSSVDDDIQSVVPDALSRLPSREDSDDSQFSPTSVGDKKKLNKSDKKRTKPTKGEEKKKDESFYYSTDGLTVPQAQAILTQRSKLLEELDRQIAVAQGESRDTRDLLLMKDKLSDDTLNNRLNITKNALKQERDDWLQEDQSREGEIGQEEMDRRTKILGEIALIRQFQKQHNLSLKIKVVALAKDAGSATVDGATVAVNAAGRALVSAANNARPVGGAILSTIGDGVGYLYHRVFG